jgi:hypothetical protein
MFSARKKAVKYREEMEKLGLYTLIESVDEQGQIIPP